LERLASEINIDTSRVYAAGMSNGAMMAYRLASEAADVFAAIATVAGTMGTEACSPSRPVSVIHFHGTDDEFVPVGGGVGRRSVTNTHHFSVEHTIRAWVDADGCPSRPAITPLQNIQEDGTSTVQYVYGPGREQSEVVLYLIHGAGHIWPGRPPRPHYLGKSTNNILANDLIWQHFQRHVR
jgi:polyhydroxybutyrate depolymerase